MINTILSLALLGFSALRVDCPPEIDGQLTDGCWVLAETVTEQFTAFRPRSGVPMSRTTSVSLVYDSHSLYFGFFMHDPEPESMNLQALARDEDAPVDKVYIYLDTFGDRANCFVFTLTAQGTQLDSRRTAIGGEDRNWDAVWSSATVMCDSGWSAEVAIPFSALRYSPGGEQNWGINFARTVSSTNEAGYLYPMEEGGGIDPSLFGVIRGLFQLPTGLRTRFRPFVAGRLQFTPGEDILKDPWGGAGVDVKVPLSMSTVLDLSVFPDFGQVESDADQGSISHWAPWLSEKRPFFMEGTEVFSMPFDMFYSRRIGSVAGNGELIRILGGAKVTGTSGGFRYGVLEVVTGEVWSGDTALVQPAVSYFAGSALGEFSRDNWLKISTTTADSPPREGLSYDYGRSASLSGMATPFQDIHLQGKLGLTWNRGDEYSDNSALRFDAGWFPERFQVNFRYQRKGDNFDPEWLGYFQGNGERSWSAYSSLSLDVNSGVIDDLWFDVNPWYTTDLQGRNAGSGVTASAGGVTVDRYDLNIWAGYRDRWFDRYEGPGGRWYPGGFSAGLSSSTDYRKPLAAWVSLNRTDYLDSHMAKLAAGFRIKPFPALFLSIEPSARLQEAATRYNHDTGEWELTDSDWRSLNISATLFPRADMRIRFSGQTSRFRRNWDTGESSSLSDRIWGNLLYSWEYAPGSWFHFLAGEVLEGDEEPVFTVYAKLMRYF